MFEPYYTRLGKTILIKKAEFAFALKNVTITTAATNPILFTVCWCPRTWAPYLGLSDLVCGEVKSAVSEGDCQQALPHIAG
jgi:hypothetical protein